MLDPVEFNGSVFLAFENDVNLGVLLMVMLASIPVNLREMDCTGKLWLFGEGTTCHSARTRDGGQRGQIDDGGLG